MCYAYHSVVTAVTVAYFLGVPVLWAVVVLQPDQASGNLQPKSGRGVSRWEITEQEHQGSRGILVELTQQDSC